MKRLSSNPGTIRTQITRCETSIAHFEGELKTTPQEDTHERQAIQKDLEEERRTRTRLQQHLDSLEDEFNDMSDTGFVYSNVQDFQE